MFLAWLPVLAYAALIFTLSSLPDLRPPGNAAQSDKLAHLVEYGILGWLLARAGRLSGVRSSRRWALVVGLGLAVAVADELYQGTVGRMTSAADVAADGLGLALVAAWDRWLRRSPEPHRGAGRGPGDPGRAERGEPPSARSE